jgi:hypothetical protein
MEEQRRAYGAFMTLRSSGVGPAEEPVAHLQFYDGATSSHMSGPLVAFTRENVVDEFNVESDLVRWLLNQMSTYEPTRQCIVGLVFDKSTILSDVLMVRQ